MNNGKYLLLQQFAHEDIEKTIYRDGIKGSKLLSLGPINDVNIFVGANNSGKSRMLRSILKSDRYLLSRNPNTVQFLEEIRQVLKEAEKQLENLKSHLSYAINLRSNFDNDLIIGVNHRYVIQKVLVQKKNYIVNIRTAYFDELDKLVTKLFEKDETIDSSNEELLRFYREISLFLDILELEKSEFKKLSRIIQSGNLNFSLVRNRDIGNLDGLLRRMAELIRKIERGKLTGQSNKNKIYLPTLRTINSLIKDNHNKYQENIFRKTIEKVYSIKSDDDETNSRIKIVTGLDLYREIRQTRNNRKNVRLKFEAFEEFLSNNFFEGQEVDIVAKESRNHSEENIIVYVGGEDRDIYDLGDGIQAIILLMYSMFTCENDTWIFIEEPEINLHPGLQRIFINQIISNPTLTEKNLKIFFTTHSNHLLDLTLEMDDNVSVFSFEKKKDTQEIAHHVKNVLRKDLNILKGLGVRNSSVFLSNCTIWIEGITDRIILKAYLNAYHDAHQELERFKEDIHYSFLEYAGSNLTHYVFDPNLELGDEINALFISNKIFLISDLDMGKENKHLNYLAQENESFRYRNLNVREIENIVSSSELKIILPRLFKNVSEEEIQSISINPSHYRTKYLGDYISKKISKDSLPKKDRYMAKSGTLKSYYKNKFAGIIEDIADWDLMSREARELTREIYTYIKTSNA